VRAGERVCTGKGEEFCAGMAELWAGVKWFAVMAPAADLGLMEGELREVMCWCLYFFLRCFLALATGQNKGITCLVRLAANTGGKPLYWRYFPRTYLFSIDRDKALRGSAAHSREFTYMQSGVLC